MQKDITTGCQNGMTLLELIMAIVIFGIVGGMLTSIVMLFAGFEEPEKVDKFTLQAQSCAEVMVAIHDEGLLNSSAIEDEIDNGGGVICEDLVSFLDGAAPGHANDALGDFCDIDLSTKDYSEGERFFICEISHDEYSSIEISLSY